MQQAAAVLQRVVQEKAHIGLKQQHPPEQHVELWPRLDSKAASKRRVQRALRCARAALRQQDGSLHEARLRVSGAAAQYVGQLAQRCGAVTVDKVAAGTQKSKGVQARREARKRVEEREAAADRARCGSG